MEQQPDATHVEPWSNMWSHGATCGATEQHVEPWSNMWSHRAACGAMEQQPDATHDQRLYGICHVYSVSVRAAFSRTGQSLVALSAWFDRSVSLSAWFDVSLTVSLVGLGIRSEGRAKVINVTVTLTDVTRKH
ncbi:hypothetical protein ACOMHN_027591 [Nucella lapillus]